MRAIASVAIAAALAATSLTTTVTPADAGGKHWKKYSHHHHGKPYKYRYHKKRWNPGAALATGAVLGFAFGALASPPTYYYAPKVYAYPPPPPPPPYPARSYSYNHGMSPQHVSYCYSKYRSYNVKYNTWIGFDGLVHQCVSPY